MKKPLIIIGGATATGKSDIAILLAGKIGADIISADSMQVYKYMDIGTAKLNKTEMKGIRHYLINELEPTEEFNVYKFKSLSEKYISEIYKNNKVPIIAGGTGFYIQSVLYDIDFSDENENTYRKELEDIYEKQGGEVLYELLKKTDQKAADNIHPNNIKRVIRALEYHANSGQMISEHNDSQRGKESPYDYLYFILNRNREEIYESINIRVDKMFAEGLVDEVKNLLDMGVSKDALSMQAIGYKEIIPYLEGKRDYDETIRLVKQNTRHYAKRQITWFKREKDAIWIDLNEFESIQSVVCFMADKYYKKIKE